MGEVHLSTKQMSAMRALLRLEPVPGQPLPEQQAFKLLHALVPSDVLGAACTDMHGHLISGIEMLPRSRHGNVMSVTAPRPCPGDAGYGPHYLGYMHWREHPGAAEGCGIEIHHDDGLAIGFRNGTDHVVQCYFGRSGGSYSPDELALLWLLGPTLQRLVRERPTPYLSSSLTATERRILSQVAAGRSNPEIADDFTIATSTVRKHLENSYRKLGVTNRVAAIARLQGRDEPALDLRERLDRYA